MLYPKKQRRFRRHLKRTLVARMQAGETVSALAREFSVQRSLLYRWRGAFRADGKAALRACRGCTVDALMPASIEVPSSMARNPIEAARTVKAAHDSLAPTVDHGSLDLHRAKPRESLDATRTFHSGIQDVDGLARHKIPVHNHGMSWRLDTGNGASEGTAWADDRLSPGRTWLSKTSGEFLIIRLYKTGRPIAFDDDDIREISSSCISMSDRFDSLWLETEKNQSLVMRADRLASDRIEPAHKTGPTGSPSGRILHTALSTLFMVLPLCSPSGAYTLGTVSVTLLRAALDDRIGREDPQEKITLARSRALQAFVAAHAFSDRFVAADRLATTFSVSRATVYRAFEDVGGIHRFITKIRLLRSFGQLAAAKAGRGRVGRIANACGYPDLAHFSRVFKREFGCTPSDILGLRNRESQESAGSEAQEHASPLTPMIRLPS